MLAFFSISVCLLEIFKEILPQNPSKLSTSFIGSITCFLWNPNIVLNSSHSAQIEKLLLVLEFSLIFAFFQSIMTEEDLNNGSYLKELKENGGKGMEITECNQNGCNWTPLSSNENLKYEEILVSFNLFIRSNIES